MNELFDTRPNERGGARLKFVIAITVFAAVVYAGYLYVPVAADAYYFRDLMQIKADAAATQGYEPTWVKDQLVKSYAEYHVPPDAVITTNSKDNRIEVHVQYTRPIEIPGYTYKYEFDHTTKSTAFLSIK